MAEHIDLLESTEHYNDEQLEQLSSRYDSIYVHNVCLKNETYKYYKLLIISIYFDANYIST